MASPPTNSTTVSTDITAFKFDGTYYIVSDSEEITWLFVMNYIMEL